VPANGNPGRGHVSRPSSVTLGRDIEDRCES
jgi:hypothetical protein